MLAAYRLLSALADRVPVPRGVFHASRTGRRGAAERWLAWAHTARGDGRVIWAHGASAGEHQVLDPVIERLAHGRSELTVVRSHTSPSMLRTQPSADGCHCDYLPWDRPADIGRVLDAVRPGVALFARADLWPGVVAGLGARGIPIAVVGATVRPGSTRNAPIARALLRATHARVAWLGAATEADAHRWRRLGVPPDRITVTGDPRHDRLVERIADAAPARALRAWGGTAPVFLAASVEPSDDAAVTRAAHHLRAELPELGTVVVPHDPTPARVDALHRALERRGLTVVRWDGAAPLPPNARRAVLVVSAHGRLADLYLGADVAYVGGGFRPGRLHAVVEPAVVGLPVLVGRRWRGVPDVEAMVWRGGAVAVHDHRALARAVASLARDPGERARVGLLARSVLSTGAARVSADAVLALLARGA